MLAVPRLLVLKDIATHEEVLIAECKKRGIKEIICTGWVCHQNRFIGLLFCCVEDHLTHQFVFFGVMIAIRLEKLSGKSDISFCALKSRMRLVLGTN